MDDLSISDVGPPQKRSRGSRGREIETSSSSSSFFGGNNSIYILVGALGITAGIVVFLYREMNKFKGQINNLSSSVKKLSEKENEEVPLLPDISMLTQKIDTNSKSVNDVDYKLEQLIMAITRQAPSENNSQNYQQSTPIRKSNIVVEEIDENCEDGICYVPDPKAKVIKKQIEIQ